MAKKVVRRRAPRPPKAPHPAEPQTLPIPAQGETTSCACEKMSLTIEGDQAVIRGHAFAHSFRYAFCGHCQTKIAFSPLLVWETGSGKRYTTAERVAAGESTEIR